MFFTICLQTKQPHYINLNIHIHKKYLLHVSNILKSTSRKPALSQGGPIKPKVVTSTKDLRKGSKKIDAEKIVLDGGEVQGGRSRETLCAGWLSDPPFPASIMLSNQLAYLYVGM